MYHFAIVALLGLATLKVVDLLEELVPALDRFNTLLRLAVGVAIAVVADYSLFTGFGVSFRENWMETWGTGLVIGSMATVWRAGLGWLGAIDEEGHETRHSHHGPRRIAA
jgi:hypothetical protein